MSSAFDHLVRVMRRLRRECPWDREQTHQSLLKYLKEESREVERAIRRRDHENLEEELGDLLLQIVFHAELAREKGRFNIQDVASGIARKMIRRHPHVFGKKKLKTAQEVRIQWEEIKRREKKRRRSKS